MSILNKLSNHSAPIEARHLQIRGRVQGIGFRPFVHRLATELGLIGRVANTGEGAEIYLEGQNTQLSQFALRLIRQLPSHGHIDELRSETIPRFYAAEFTIEPSIGSGLRRWRIPADRATCVSCIREIHDSSNRRHNYPFNACTDCGPRFSVIESMPYDRETTSMRRFPLCDDCQEEYRAPPNRRFHAQAMACGSCGPRLTWSSGQRSTTNANEAVQFARQSLQTGRCLALKGLGGYQLLVRADDDAAVQRLRDRKRRPTKPFAVMIPNLAMAESLAAVSFQEQQALTSAENPIVLLQQHQNSALSRWVAPGLRTVGLFLPTTPVHELLMADLGFPVIATSGNRTDEPPATNESMAQEQLSTVADAFLDNNRLIVRRLDDSVVRIIAGRPVVFRLGRGYAPWSLPTLEKTSTPPILALGGHLKVAIAAHTGEQAVLMAHLGDMDDPLNRPELPSTVRDVERLYGFRPKMLIVDQHPDYFTTRWAEAQELPLIRVQHHHAHAAAVQTEHDLLDRPVLAIAWDGTGYGSDGTIWGGEFLVTEPSGRFQRVASMWPIPLIGGEAAIREPVRIAFGMLWELLGPSIIAEDGLLRQLGITKDQALNWATMVQRNFNVVLSSAIGRLFDGFAMLVLGRQDMTYEAEAAIRLEESADTDDVETYRIEDCEKGGLSRGDWRPMLASVLGDLRHEVPPSRIAGRIHQTLANWAGSIARRFPDLPVVLGGGCFQNRQLMERTLENVGPRCHVPSTIPPGDGGLAVGQLAIALQQYGLRG